MALQTFDWLDGVLDDCRRWQSHTEDEHWYKYDPDDVVGLRPQLRIDGHVIRRHGHIQGRPLEPQAGMWREILMLFSRAAPRPDVVVLVRDLDGDDAWRKGLVQARDGYPWPFPVAVVTMAPEVEAWHVSGFVARDSSERSRLAAVQTSLNFNPTLESHRLTSHPNDAETDAKLVLRHLCEGDEIREMACLADLALLRARGTQNGLSAFLDEATERVLPAFGPASRS